MHRLYWSMPIYLLMHHLSASPIYLCLTNADADYAAERQLLNLTRVTLPLMISIETFADGLTEGTETFNVSFGTLTVFSRGVPAVEAASRVTLNSTVLLITILDSDCKCSIWVTLLPIHYYVSHICVQGGYLESLWSSAVLAIDQQVPAWTVSNHSSMIHKSWESFPSRHLRNC